MIEQNKTANRPVTGKPERRVPVINLEHCKGCGKCIEACPSGVIEIRSINPADYKQLGWFSRRRLRHHGIRVAYVVNSENCQSLGKCIEVCRKNAISKGSLIPDLA